MINLFHVNSLNMIDLINLFSMLLHSFSIKNIYYVYLIYLYIWIVHLATLLVTALWPDLGLQTACAVLRWSDTMLSQAFEL